MVYRLRLPNNYPMHPVFNIEHLKKYHQASPLQEEYEVEAILGHRLTSKKNGNRRMYLVQWKDYDPTDDSWVSEYDLQNAPALKREYLRLHNLILI
ncbi:hypothetical protein Hypma_003010 [Hypsizygus marmoreus]|uniref:Chromo domain-containing protein n=1 Tax=Hypsizygus marmoreus TaxID=39966 RepID=A0A369J6V5_HYPMA|nr:hypothetical protein Hypma_003010 [Hypsizygus marmoreus]